MSVGDCVYEGTGVVKFRVYGAGPVVEWTIELSTDRLKSLSK